MADSADSDARREVIAAHSSPPPKVAAEPDMDGAFADDGVDLTLIRWMLRKTPTERLQAAQQLIDATWALRTDRET